MKNNPDVSGETLCFVREALKHFPEFVIYLLKAMEKRSTKDIEEKAFQSLEEEHTPQNAGENFIFYCCFQICRNYPHLADGCILPYITNAIKVL